jgi:hypothetical protein
LHDPSDYGAKLGENLDRDLSLHVRVCCAVDLAHAARADLRGDFIGAETGAGLK